MDARSKRSPDAGAASQTEAEARRDEGNQHSGREDRPTGSRRRSDVALRNRLYIPERVELDCGSAAGGYAVQLGSKRAYGRKKRARGPGDS
jgi:hypothetical protein